MNILVVADRFFPSEHGGLARVAWDAAKALARRGHHVEFIAAEVGPVDQPDVRDIIDGVVVHRFFRPAFAAWHPQRASVPIRMFRDRIRRCLQVSRFDILHFHSIFTGESALRATSDSRGGPAMVYTVHSPVVPEQRLTWSRQGWIGTLNTWAGVPVVRRMERRLLAVAGAVHVLSAFTAAELRREHPDLDLSCEVIPHFMYAEWTRLLSRPEARERLAWRGQGKSLFTVRQLRYRYGIADAIVAVAPLAAAGECTFWIAGDGPDRPQLQRLIDTLGVSDTIRLLGRVSDELLQVAYQAADLFLLPTRHLECFGLISLEAMAYGLPVLGTEVGAIPEVLQPVLPGFLAPAGQPTALREKIDDYLHGRLVPPDGEEIRRRVVDRYSEAAVMARYERLYAAALSRSQGSAPPGSPRR